MAKSAGNSGFGHIYWRNPYWKTSFFVQCIIHEIIIMILTIFEALLVAEVHDIHLKKISSIAKT